MITKTKRAIEMIVLGLIIISCFTHSALNSCSASSHETTTTTAKAKKEEIGQLFERACFSENYERAASVAQDISNMAMKDIVSTNGFAVRERERGIVRFTHDRTNAGQDAVNDQLLSEEEAMQRTANTGNPGVMYARIEEVNAINQAWPYFQFSRRDASVVITCAPPTVAKYYSFVTYVWRKTFGRTLGLRALRATVSAQARSGAVNIGNENGKQTTTTTRAFQRPIIIITTASEKTFQAIKKTFVDIGIDETSIELEALRYDELNFLPSIIADDLTTSFRVSTWPLKGAEALGFYAKFEWPAFLVRADEEGIRRGTSGDDIFYDAKNLPMRKARSENVTGSKNQRIVVTQEQLDAVALSIENALKTKFDQDIERFRLQRVDVGDGSKCLESISYQPFALPGVQTRSGCFGSTSDAAYSLSEKLVNNLGELSDGDLILDSTAVLESNQEFVILIVGSNEVFNERATFFNIAAYTSGNPVLSRRSARNVQIVASLDDRSFKSSSVSSLLQQSNNDNSNNSNSFFVAAFGTSDKACSNVKGISCAVMLDRNFGNIFLIERVYLDPETALAPIDITQSVAFVIKV